MSQASVVAACRAAPAYLHSDGLIVAFDNEDGLSVANSHMSCAPDLTCAYAPGGPSDDQPPIGTARLNVRSPLQLTACLGASCIELGRCSAPDWTGREYLTGLARRWEAGATAR